MDSPHLEEKLIGEDCRSISPLSEPTKRCKNLGGMREESSSRGSTILIKKCDLEPLTLGKKDAHFIGKSNMTIWSQNLVVLTHNKTILVSVGARPGYDRKS
jgi:hypothetical protein